MTVQREVSNQTPYSRSARANATTSHESRVNQHHIVARGEIAHHAALSNIGTVEHKCATVNHAESQMPVNSINSHF
jgi:hypothetical protein